MISRLGPLFASFGLMVGLFSLSSPLPAADGSAGEAPVPAFAPLTAGEDALVGKPAPEFDLPLRNGEKLNLASRKGKVVILNFWATWCPPCVEEIPALNRLHRQLRDLPVEVIGISVDDGWAPVDQLLLKRPVNFTLALDTSRGVPTRYNTSKFPETFIIDKQGTVVKKLVGAQLWDRGDFIDYLSQLASK